MSSESGVKHTYSPNVQAARGLSILLVLLSHFFHWPRHAGTLGVSLFFCISGYLITSILLDEFQQNGTVNYREFYLRRARRLLPLAYVVILVTTLIFIILRFCYPRLETFPDLLINQKQLLLSALFCLAYVGNLFGHAHIGFNDLTFPLGHFWSLGVEEQFYIFWPGSLVFMLRKYTNSKMLKFVTVGIFLSIVFRTFLTLANKTVWTLPTTYLDILLAGAFIAILKFRFSVFITKRISLYFMLPCVASLIYIFYSTIAQADYSGMGYVIISIAVISGFICLLGFPIFGSIKPLKWLGDYSYSLYCIHWPVYELCLFFFDNYTIRLVTAIASSFILSILSRKYLEVIFWKSRFLATN